MQQDRPVLPAPSVQQALKDLQGEMAQTAQLLERQVVALWELVGLLEALVQLVPPEEREP